MIVKIVETDGVRNLVDLVLGIEVEPALVGRDLPAGDAVIYPSSSLHRVAEVSHGERLVAVSWIQSLVKEADKRTLLHDMNLARETLLQEQPDTELTARVNHSYINLVRMWSVF